MKRFITDPKGSAYEALIDYAMEHASYFAIAIREQPGHYASSVRKVTSRLQPFLFARRSYEDLQSRSAIAYSPGEYYIYSCSKAAGDILKETADSLYSWVHPELPEDLCFLNEREQDFVINVAHEKIGGILVDEAEAERLSARIAGLFIALEAHRDNFDRFLDDAIRHQPETLEISSFGLASLPDRVRLLKNLKRLTVFEQDLYELPPALFELRKLEEFSLYTANLASVPKEIAALQQLKSLRISCGSYHHLPEGGGIIAKQDVSLNRLPPEIGELRGLEHLSVNYTSITELPPELEKLRKLRSLDMRSNLITDAPAFLSKMPNLKHVSLSSDPFGT